MRSRFYYPALRSSRQSFKARVILCPIARSQSNTFQARKFNPTTDRITQEKRENRRIELRITSFLFLLFTRSRSPKVFFPLPSSKIPSPQLLHPKSEQCRF